MCALSPTAIHVYVWYLNVYLYGKIRFLNHRNYWNEYKKRVKL